MAIRVEALYISPVKSLALQRVERARVGARGLYGDRCFFLVDDRDRLYTQRECGALVQVQAEYAEQAERLTLRFPDGTVADGTPVDGDAIVSRFFGERDVAAVVVDGPWSAALSSFARADVRLVRPAEAGNAFDGFPVSLCSMASVAAFADVAGRERVDERRFRPNIYISGVSAHGEDEWLERVVRVGDGVALRLRMRDPRCVITTHDPDTGKHDLNSLKLIASYRTDQPKEANFGVYATVEQSGEIAVGDTVVVSEQADERALAAEQR